MNTTEFAKKATYSQKARTWLRPPSEIARFNPAFPTSSPAVRDAGLPDRIASPEMLPGAYPLPHLTCSPPVCIGGGGHGADQHVDTRRVGGCAVGALRLENGVVVRRTVGYRRYEGLEAAAALARLYSSLRLFVNFFQPSFKLAGKIRDGAKVKKKYHPPATPYQRLLADARTNEEPAGSPAASRRTSSRSL